MKCFWATVLVLSGMFGTAAAVAPVATSPLLTPQQAERLGLVRPWYVHVDVDPSRGVARQATLHTSRTRYFTVYRVNYQGRELHFSERQVGPAGLPIGPDEALRLAEVKVRELAERGYEATLDEQQIPESTLYVQTNLGVLHAIDAHTGRTQWSTRVGKPFFPTIAPAANDQQVVACSGSELIWLDRGSGEIFYRRMAAKVPFGDLGISRNFAFLPTLDGTVEAYRHVDQYARTPWRLTSMGRSDGVLVTEERVAWITDRGVVYVGHSDRTGILFDVRLEGRGIGSPVLIRPGVLVLATANGFVYGLDEREGTMQWRFTTGGEISQTPLAVDGQVFVATLDDGVYALDGPSGLLQWHSRQMDIPAAVSENRLYGQSQQGELVCLDRSTGRSVASVFAPAIDLAVPNVQTDRLLVGSKQGLIQCLHAPHNSLPRVYLPRQAEPQPVDGPPAADAPPSPPPPAPQQPDAAEPDTGDFDPFDFSDPFDEFGGEQPPAAEGEPPAGEADPDLFEDPFAGLGSDS